MLKKRGQITVFIIVGILILLSTALIIYLRRPAITPETIVVPEQVVPIKEYVETCLESTAETGISIAASNGGYIYFPDEISRNPRAHLPSLIDNVMTPYWYYDGSSRIPSESLIAFQISEYIRLNLPECLANFSAFEEQYDIEETGNMSVSTDLGEEAVIVNLDYPLNIREKLNMTSVEFKDFTTSVNVRLKKAYELAREILDRENEQTFFEDLTVDLIALDNSIPDTGFEVRCVPRIWQMSELKDKLKTLLRANLPFVKFANTEYIPIPSGDDWEYMRNHYVWTFSENKYPGMHVALTYDENWPMLFYARPSSSGMLRSNPIMGQDILSWICFHLWHFTYDVVYPVQITIVDEETKRHKELVFNYAFEVSVNHNRGDRSNFALEVLPAAEIPIAEEYCSVTDKEITVYTVNNVTKDDVEDVNISFTCGRLRCDMGETELLGYGVAAGLTKQFPFCVNGILKGSKEGYEDSATFLSTGTEKAVTLEMIPIKMIEKYKVAKHKQTEPEFEEALADDEQAIITITPAGRKEQSFGMYPEEEGAALPLKFYADGDFTYNVSIYLIKDDMITGGYKGQWAVEWEDMKDADLIRFHVIEQWPETSDEIEQYLFIQALEDYSEEVPEPELQ